MGSDPWIYLFSPVNISFCYESMNFLLNLAKIALNSLSEEPINY